MRAAVMHAAGDVRIENVPDPAIAEPTDAVVRVTQACIRGSDLWPYAEMEPSETGQSMGHEAIGVVEDVGADVRTIKRGDVVVMPFAFSDGTCEFCHEGLHTACVRRVLRDVAFADAGEDANDAVDTAYRDKCGRHPRYVPPMVSDRARATTLRLVPKGEEAGA